MLLGSHHTMSCTISHGNPKRKLKYPKFSQSKSSHFGPPSSFSHFLSLILLRGNPVQKLWHPWAEPGLHSGLLCLKMPLSILFSSAFSGIPGEKRQERVKGGPTSKVYNPKSNSWPESGRVLGMKIYKFNRKAQAYALSFFLYCLKRLSCSLPLFQSSKSHVTVDHLSTVNEKLNFQF